jgi:D-glycero-alpha-D-manno-heptose-7-phosphate kinase
MIHQGSVRADLFGGTIDLDPIGLILKNTRTLNIALTIGATVKIEPLASDVLEIVSKDYDSSLKIKLSDLNGREDFQDLGPLCFLLALAADVGITGGLRIEVSSKAPAGSGLGGSSSLGVIFYQALLRYYKKTENLLEIITRVKNIEAVNLNCGPTGFQDYYPALYGGILALSMTYGGVQVEQLFTQELKTFLEKHLLLIFSGETRFSGINNWEVYKGFFDKDKTIRDGFDVLADLSAKAYKAIKEKNYEDLLDLLALEGQARRELFPKILTPAMIKFSELALLKGKIHLKVCGAGGGGCFLVVLKDPSVKETVRSLLAEHQMRELEFAVAEPLNAN